MGRKKRKVSLNIFSIFFSSVKVYFLYLDKFVKYLLFPVFGQIFGIIAIFTIAYLFNTNSETLQMKIPFLADEKNFFIVYICCLVPFFIIFMKAFYDYIIAFSSLNSVCYIITPKKKVQDVDFKTHDSAIERRLFPYIVLLFLFSLLSIVLLIPIFWIFIPFLILIFQVFALEQSAGPVSSIGRSIDLVRGHYFVTLLAIILCLLFTYVLIPDLFVWTFNYFRITPFLTSPVENFVSVMPIDFGRINEVLKAAGSSDIYNSSTIAKMLVESTVYSIFVMFTLPLRCCVFTNLYAALDIDAIGRNAQSEGDDGND